MSQFTESDAERLSPEQATALVRILELQARWETLLGAKSDNAIDLHGRQKAHDAFQNATRGYAEKHGRLDIPEPTQVTPDRLAVWCRILRSILKRAESVTASHLTAKVYRLVGRIAAKLEKEPPSGSDLLELDAVIAWCETLVPTSLLRKKSA